MRPPQDKIDSLFLKKDSILDYLETISDHPLQFLRPITAGSKPTKRRFCLIFRASRMQNTYWSFSDLMDVQNY